MQKLLLALCLVLTFSGCDQRRTGKWKQPQKLSLEPQGLKGKKYYTFTASMVFVTESELDFITEDKVNITITMLANFKETLNRKDNRELIEYSRILPYTWKDGILGIPSLNRYSQLKPLENGNLITNTHEFLYTTSVLDYPGVAVIKERIKALALDEQSEKMCIELIDPASKPPVDQPRKPVIAPVKMQDVVLPEEPEVPAIENNKSE